MIDLICLVADKNIEATMQGILARPSALGIPTISYETIVHPNRDPGCFHQWNDLLAGFRNRAAHALIVLDFAWDGAPVRSGVELESLLGESIARIYSENWACPLVIDPELEAWIFSDSPHVAAALGWSEQFAHMRDVLAVQGHWPNSHEKPPDPKAAVEWILRCTRTPRSSSLYRGLASKVSFDRCRDRAFLRLKTRLVDWFG